MAALDSQWMRNVCRPRDREAEVMQTIEAIAELQREIRRVDTQIAIILLSASRRACRASLLGIGAGAESRSKTPESASPSNAPLPFSPRRESAAAPV